MSIDANRDSFDGNPGKISHNVGSYKPQELSFGSLEDLSVESIRKEISTALMNAYKDNSNLDLVKALEALENMSPEAIRNLQAKANSQSDKLNQQAAILPVAMVVLGVIYFEELMTTAIVAPLGYGSAGVDLVSGNSKEAQIKFDQTNKTLEKVWKPKPESVSVHGGVTR